MIESNYVKPESKDNIWGANKYMRSHLIYDFLFIIIKIIFILIINIAIAKIPAIIVVLIILDLGFLIYIIMNFSYFLTKLKLWNNLKKDISKNKLLTDTYIGVVDTKSKGDYKEFKTNVFAYAIVLDNRRWKGGKEFFVDKNLYTDVETTIYDWSITEQKEIGKKKLGSKIKLIYLINSKIVTNWEILN